MPQQVLFYYCLQVTYWVILMQCCNTPILHLLHFAGHLLQVPFWDVCFYFSNLGFYHWKWAKSIILG